MVNSLTSASDRATLNGPASTVPSSAVMWLAVNPPSGAAAKPVIAIVPKLMSIPGT